MSSSLDLNGSYMFLFFFLGVHAPMPKLGELRGMPATPSFCGHQWHHRQSTEHRVQSKHRWWWWSYSYSYSYCCYCWQARDTDGRRQMEMLGERGTGNGDRPWAETETEDLVANGTGAVLFSVWVVMHRQRWTNHMAPICVSRFWTWLLNSSKCLMPHDLTNDEQITAQKQIQLMGSLQANIYVCILSA